ncbi:endonuclease/exonuclease/phosphatase family protein [Sciscionella marina]|uniref:endonuclease/exonuclease/phosphatase family protein n=1 Tax=Sciscionella marina TaxID=508770 RepID=UPI00035D7685|nr:endonuclease/exonuclease/phosphatase family protein [Sciscionella marina]
MRGTVIRSTSRNLLVVCAAAAMTAGVTAAPAGATADGVTASALPVKAMTWNACANTKPAKGDNRCRIGRRTDEVVATIHDRIAKNQPDTRVLFLQEVCSVDIQQLAKSGLSGWHWKFAPIRFQGSGGKPGSAVTDRRCAADTKTKKSRGSFGIAVGVRADANFQARYYPDAHQPIDNRHKDVYGYWNVRQAAVCASVADWKTTVCGTHLTPLSDKAADPAVYRSAQAAQVKDLMSYAKQGVGGAAYKRVLFGGDLNQAAPDGDYGSGNASTLAPAYAQYAECDQGAHGGKRNGENTYQNADGKVTRKLDYLFTDKDAASKCYVTDKHVSSSDHKPVVDTVTFPG